MKNTKKILLALLMIIAIVFSLSIPAFASAPTADGSYSVPIVLYHAEKEKESMGNKYVVQKALITIENGKKYITIVANEEADLSFYYYLDGSTEGETAEAERLKNVTFDGTTYPMGFKFPLVTDKDSVGVKISASFIPVKPSARIMIDYNNVKTLSVKETTVEAESKAEEATSVVDAKETETENPVTDESQTALNAETENTTETTSETETTLQENVDAVAENEAETETKSSNSTLYIIIAIVLIIVIVACIIIKKKKK